MYLHTTCAFSAQQLYAILVPLHVTSRAVVYAAWSQRTRLRVSSDSGIAAALRFSDVSSLEIFSTLSIQFASCRTSFSLHLAVFVQLSMQQHGLAYVQ